MERRKKAIPTTRIVAFLVVSLVLYVLSSSPAAALVTSLGLPEQWWSTMYAPLIGAGEHCDRFEFYRIWWARLCLELPV